MSSKNIYHPGKISDITGDKVLVSIINLSACAACHAKGMCTVSDMKEKIIELNLRKDQHTYSIGDNVDVFYEESRGLLAVFYGYVFPLILLMTTLFVTHNYFNSELIVALTSILSVVIYYIILYLFRNSIRKKFVFKIRKSYNEN